MKLSEIMKESSKRFVSKTLRASRAVREQKSIERSLFLNMLDKTKGKILLKYVKVHKKNVEEIPHAVVTKHIVNQLNISINTVQVGMIHIMLEKLGAITYRTERRRYYLNVELLVPDDD